MLLLLFMSGNNRVGRKQTEDKVKNMLLCFHGKFSFFNDVFDSVTRLC